MTLKSTHYCRLIISIHDANNNLLFQKANGNKLLIFQILLQNSENFIIPQRNNFVFQEIVFKKVYFEKWLRIKSHNRISSQKLNFYTPISRGLLSESYDISPWKN